MPNRSARQDMEPLLPFPRLPEAFKAGCEASELWLRPFGLYEGDLDVDFDLSLRPVLVTHILECCARHGSANLVEPEFIWDLTIGKRIECLLTLLLPQWKAGIPVLLRCPNGACGQEVEIEIAFEEIAALQEEAYAADPIVVALEERTFTLRRPTGRDQREWLEKHFADERDAVREMVRTLLLDDEARSIGQGAPGDAWVRSVEEAMVEHDPLVDFNLLVRCPDCGEENRCGIDLEEFALRELRQEQLRLLGSVHTLAAHYHWSEAQIFSVPWWRRARYLGLIEKDKSP